MRPRGSATARLEGRGEADRALVLHQRAQEAWLEAVTLADEQRQRTTAAEARSQERQRAAEQALGVRRRDAYALGLLDAARLYADAARRERERLRDAERRCAQLAKAAQQARLALQNALGREAA
jgi:hypothetical protein